MRNVYSANALERKIEMTSINTFPFGTPTVVFNPNTDRYDVVIIGKMSYRRIACNFRTLAEVATWARAKGGELGEYRTSEEKINYYEIRLPRPEKKRVGYTASQVKFLQTLLKLTHQHNVDDPNEDRMYHLSDFCEEYGVGVEWHTEHSARYQGYYSVQAEGLNNIADVPLYLIPD
jgi:hypothetical protein